LFNGSRTYLIKADARFAPTGQWAKINAHRFPDGVPDVKRTVSVVPLSSKVVGRHDLGFGESDSCVLVQLPSASLATEHSGALRFFTTHAGDLTSAVMVSFDAPNEHYLVRAIDPDSSTLTVSLIDGEATSNEDFTGIVIAVERAHSMLTILRPLSGRSDSLMRSTREFNEQYCGAAPVNQPTSDFLSLKRGLPRGQYDRAGANISGSRNCADSAVVSLLAASPHVARSLVRVVCADSLLDGQRQAMVMRGHDDLSGLSTPIDRLYTALGLSVAYVLAPESGEGCVGTSGPVDWRAVLATMAEPPGDSFSHCCVS
jgi:hypothetical protein